MIGIVPDDTGRVAGWVAEQLEFDGGFGPHFAVGIRDGETPIAGIVYHHMTDRDTQVSMAAISPKWCRRGTLQYLFRAPFQHLGKTRMTAITAKRNKRARKLLSGLGFREEGRAEKYFDDSRNGDAIIYGILRNNCKWIENHG
jgi:RimJ/RimL family protein N-acetyltransferase|tara:strand:+ start:1611 stop:2039 length:429 start_codon:yes stop_codon:yes gene_type:complete